MGCGRIEGLVEAKGQRVEDKDGEMDPRGFNVELHAKGWPDRTTWGMRSNIDKTGQVSHTISFPRCGYLLPSFFCGQMRLKCVEVCFCCAPIGRSDVKGLAKGSRTLVADQRTMGLAETSE
jgi:hypothetical protein